MGLKNRLVGGLLAVAGTLAGCGDPPLADIASEGGNVTDPTGVIEGTVTYLGPRPLCEYKDGKPTKLRATGAVLILYGFKDPPPPNGPLPASVLIVPATKFFSSLGDCMPESPSVADLHESITRSAAFTWPRIPLGAGLTPVSYRIEAIFDSDGDYYPLLLTHNIPTAGDLLGGALRSFGKGTCPNNLDCLEVKFDGPCAHKVGDSSRVDGQVVKGISVNVALPLWTERLMFEPKQVDATDPTIPKYLSSQQTFDVSGLQTPGLDPSVAATHRRAAYERMRNWSGLTLSLIDEERASPDCKDTADKKCVGPRLKQLGLDYDLLDRRAYAWHLYPLAPAADGSPTLHPMSYVFGPRSGTSTDQFIFSENTQWTLPQVFLSRIQSEEEKLAGIPSVGLIGGVDAFVQAEHSVYKQDLPVTVLPSASMTLPATDGSTCSVSITPAGNSSFGYEQGASPTDCQEIPPGDYSYVVVAGLAGNLVYVEDPKSETGYNIAPAADGLPLTVVGPGQIWLNPNDLGDPAKFVNGFKGDEKARMQQASSFAIDSQGAKAAFKVRDPDPTNDVRPYLRDSDQIVEMDTDGQCHLYGDCADAVRPGVENAFQGIVKEIEFQPIPEKCCTAHTVSMCNVPVCKPDSTDPGLRAAVKLQAWVSNSELPSDKLGRENALDNLQKREDGMSLSEAKALSATGKKVYFRGVFREAGEKETPTLIIPRPANMPSELTRAISYEELTTPVVETVASDPFDCEAAAAAQKATPKPSANVRLKLVGLDPSCVPFKMPAQCCGETEPEENNDGYGKCN